MTSVATQKLPQKLLRLLELGARDYHLQIAVMADGDDLYFRVTDNFFCFFSPPTSLTF
jgi:hypothetical protein